jgi:L-2,4-diaminobutyrate decarboxylase
LDERYVVERPGTPEFRAAIDQLVEACIEFKLRAPYDVPPVRMDRGALRRAAAIGDAGVPLRSILAEFRDDVLSSCLNFSSPTFLAHPDAGNAVAGILGDVANAFLQQNLSSIDYGPAATVLEIELLHTLRMVVGYPDGDGRETALNAGGAFLFGGAGANFACLLAAREHLKARLAGSARGYDPRRTRVLGNRPFTHFSLRRSLHMLGLGNRDLSAEVRQASGLDREALREVSTTRFRMDPDDLERQIEATLERGEDIMCVFAVAGDSRFMAFDDLERVTEIAGRYGLWVHVDACEGGQVLFSPRRRHLMRAVERTHSISLDPHKVLLVPYNLSLFFLRDSSWLAYFSGEPAQVINQDEDSLGGYTPAVNSKSFISLKLLFMLRHWGWRRLAAEVDRRHELARQAASWIEEHPNLRLINPDVEHNAVAFMYLPDGEPHGPEELNALNRSIHQQLNMETRFFLHTFPARDDQQRVRADRGTVHPLRMMFGNPLSDWPVVRDCLETVAKLGYELAGDVACRR